MQIKKAAFVTSFASADKYEEYALSCRTPEICVVGRSNVGKSTFINMLAGQSRLAKTSSAPGRTRLINLFDFNDGLFRLADLPGYGYALAAKTQRNEWGSLIENYLLNSENLRHTLVLVDSRHTPSADDVAMTEYLYYYRMPFTVIATKCDKLKRSQLPASALNIAAALKIGRDNIIFTDMFGLGRAETSARIEEVLTTSSL